tara:strand:- start:2302 stop:2772 length:471 start_codon:yes stop_codon:yes gene_type:complete
MSNLNPYEIAVLKSVSASLAKSARSSMPESPKFRGACLPEPVDVTMTIHVSGHVRVEQDSFGVPHYTSVPWADLAALLFSKVNDETREAVIRQALAGNVNSDQKAEAKDAVQKLQSQTTIDRKGAVKVIDGSVTVVSRTDDEDSLDWCVEENTISA